MRIYSDRVVREAQELRRQNLSYREIERLLKVPNTTIIRKWCFEIKAGKGRSLQGIKRSEKLRRRIIKREEGFVKRLTTEIDRDKAKLLASILYWCGGTKYPVVSGVRFVNSDEQMMKTFIYLLRKGFNLDEKKFRVHLQIHDTHDFEELRKHWSNLLDISKDQFIKPTVTNPTGNRRRKNYKGTCTLRYHDYRALLKLTAIYKNLALG